MFNRAHKQGNKKSGNPYGLPLYIIGYNYYYSAPQFSLAKRL